MWEPKLPLALLSARGYFGSHMLSPLNFSNHLLKVLFALCPLPLLSLFTKFCQDLGQDLRQHPVTSQNKEVGVFTSSLFFMPPLFATSLGLDDRVLGTL